MGGRQRLRAAPSHRSIPSRLEHVTPCSNQRAPHFLRTRAVRRPVFPQARRQRCCSAPMPLRSPACGAWLDPGPGPSAAASSCRLQSTWSPRCCCRKPPPSLHSGRLEPAPSGDRKGNGAKGKERAHAHAHKREREREKGEGGAQLSAHCARGALGDGETRGKRGGPTCWYCCWGGGYCIGGGCCWGGKGCWGYCGCWTCGCWRYRGSCI